MSDSIMKNNSIKNIRNIISITFIGLFFSGVTPSFALEGREQYSFLTANILSGMDKDIVSAFLEKIEKTVPDNLKAYFKAKNKSFVVDFSKTKEVKSFIRSLSNCSKTGSSSDSRKEPETLLSKQTVYSPFDNKNNKNVSIYLDYNFFINHNDFVSNTSKVGCSDFSQYVWREILVLQRIFHAYDYMEYVSLQYPLRANLGWAYLNNSYKAIKNEIRKRKGLPSNPDPLSQEKENKWELDLREISRESLIHGEQYRDSGRAFLLNITYFFKDPEFFCRRPAAYMQLSKEFSVSPNKGACKPKNWVFVEKGSHVGASWREPSRFSHSVKEIDPNRIYEVHYLLADKASDNFIGSFGHSMFRFIVCAPSRKVVGPDCLKDETHHVILSFRMDLDLEGMHLLKAMNGKHVGRALTYSFVDIKKEYLIDENRHLYSIPFDFDEFQKNQFIYAALESYWVYFGGYKFLSLNCATESLYLLRVVDGLDPKFYALNDSVVTPFNMFETLEKYNFFVPGPLNEVKKHMEQVKKEGNQNNSMSFESKKNIEVRGMIMSIPNSESNIMENLMEDLLINPSPDIADSFYLFRSKNLNFDSLVYNKEARWMIAWIQNSGYPLNLDEKKEFFSELKTSAEARKDLFQWVLNSKLNEKERALTFLAVTERTYLNNLKKGIAEYFEMFVSASYKNIKENNEMTSLSNCLAPFGKDLNNIVNLKRPWNNIYPFARYGTPMFVSPKNLEFNGKKMIKYYNDMHSLVKKMKKCFADSDEHAGRVIKNSRVKMKMSKRNLKFFYNTLGWTYLNI